MERPDDNVVMARADFDALAAEAADARTLRTERDSLVKQLAEAWAEADRWRVARQESEDYIAAVAKATGGSWKGDIDFLDHIKHLTAATARADALAALLKEARGCVAVNYGPNEFSRLLARIDAALEEKK